MKEKLQAINPLDKKRIVQIIAYLAVGGGTALFELVIFSTLYYALAIDPAVANILAVVVATATNFLLNGTVTFKGSSNLVRSVVFYILLFLINTCFSTCTVSYFVGIGVPALGVKLFTMACIVAWNFVLYKKVVFA